MVSAVGLPHAHSEKHTEREAIRRLRGGDDARPPDGNLAEVRLYPTELGVDRPDSRLGIPRIAPPDIGQRILERIQRLSRALGTMIEIDGNTGVIRF